jgi:hypothetical protein
LLAILKIQGKAKVGSENAKTFAGELAQGPKRQMAKMHIYEMWL